MKKILLTMFFLLLFIPSLFLNRLCAAQQSLLDAVKKGDVKAVTEAIKGGADVSERNGNGDTALIFAASKGYIEIAALLIGGGLDINAGNNEGWTALMSAVDRGNIEMVKFLLEKGADVKACADLKGVGKRTPLKIARLRKREDIVKLLTAPVEKKAVEGASADAAVKKTAGGDKTPAPAAGADNKTPLLAPREPSIPVALVKTLDALDDETLKRIAEQFIPADAQLAPALDKKDRGITSAISKFDAGGEIGTVIAATYASAEDPYYGGVVFLMKKDGKAVKAYEKNGEACSLRTLDFAPVEGKDKMNPVIGYFMGGSAGCSLEVLGWRSGKLQVIGEGAFNRIEIEDMAGTSGKDGKAELALWAKDTGPFCIVEVVCYEEGKGLVPVADDVRRFYFKRVVDYYKGLFKEFPDGEFPREYYYLADSQVKAGMFGDALETVKKGLECAKKENAANSGKDSDDHWPADFKIIEDAAKAGLAKK